METAGAPMTLSVPMHPLDWAVIGVYVIGIVLLGLWFGSFTRDTSDFFLGGQRFSWWVGSVACVATLIGSYSFLQYSQNGYLFGFSSMTAYTNEWFVLPLFLLVWLPIIYYSRLTSIPEYFERRFDRRTRVAVLVIMLVYLQGYIAFNLYSIGFAAQSLAGGSMLFWAALIALLTAIVIYAGGATSVMMADLFQAVLLLSAGLLVFVLGVREVGGPGRFLDGLSSTQKLPFANFNSPKEFHFIGDFWSDAITGTIAFYFINQGVLMRILSVKSVREARKTVLFTVVVLMPLAAIAVSGAGWVGRAIVTHHGDDALEFSVDGREGGDSTVRSIPAPPDERAGKDIFIRVVRKLCAPGVFGFVMAAMLAAMMSTLEALINALSAVAVTDIWRPFLQPGRSDAHYLRIARLVAIAGYVLGLILIPIFAPFGSIYEALTHFNAIVVPPMVVVICLGVLWERFTPAAAFWTLILGLAALGASLFWPEMIRPFAHGEPVDPADAPWKHYSYMRSLFGLVVSGTLGVTITLVTRPKPVEQLAGLTLRTIAAGRRKFKGGEPNDRALGRSVIATPSIEDVPAGSIRLSRALMDGLEARPGDLMYVSDARWWLGGLRSIHVRAIEPTQAEAPVGLARLDVERGKLKLNRPVRIEKLL
jgi:solute:Na+ symporter, SSS family